MFVITYYLMCVKTMNDESLANLVNQHAKQVGRQILANLPCS